MELSDSVLLKNRDRDPSYLSSIFDVDFYEINDLWNSSMSDFELMEGVNFVEKYCPIVEDISMDDEELCQAVETIEEGYVVYEFLTLHHDTMFRNISVLFTLLLFYYRLKCSESVQYFQFDSEGNMFVFKPGSGFSGPSVKVQPGFEIEECMQESFFSNTISQDMSLIDVSKVEYSTQCVTSDHDNMDSSVEKRYYI